MLSKPWFLILLILCLGFAAYSFMLGSSFRVLDDEYSIVHNLAIQNGQNIKNIFSQGFFNEPIYYRPLVNLSFLLEYQRYGLNSFFYNLDNLFLHILNTLLVWNLSSMLLKNSRQGFICSLLFLIHPINTEAVSNISGRAILLGASFILTSFICFLRYDRYANKKFLGASVITLILGLLCKESAIVFPVVISVYLWAQQRPVSRSFPLWGIVGLYLLWRFNLGLMHTFTWETNSQAVLGFISFLRSLMTDLRLLFYPVGLYFDRSQSLFLSFKDSQVWMTTLLWLAALMVLFIKRRNISYIGWFFLAWFVCEMAPVSQIVHVIGVAPGMISSADHFLYIASIPLFILMVQMGGMILKANQGKQWVRPEFLKGLVIGFFIFLFLINIEQNIYAGNEMAMLQRSIEFQPRNARVQSSLGILYARRGEFRRAQEHFSMAVAASPQNPRYRISLGKSFCDQGYYEECLKIYNQIDNPGSFAKLLDENKKIATQLMAQQHVQILSR